MHRKGFLIIAVFTGILQHFFTFEKSKPSQGKNADTKNDETDTASRHNDAVFYCIMHSPPGTG